jgi:CelD/BcsL family acetyltransferase involved in cellulose biosynthesis
MMQINFLPGATAFGRLENEWNELSGRGMTATPFQTLPYQQSWWGNLGAGDLLTLTARNKTGILQGIGCFYLLDGILKFNGCTEESDYLDLISPAAHAAPVWAAFLQRMVATDFPSWSAMDLCNIPASSPTRSILPELATSYGWSVQESVFEVCPVITLPASFADYLASLDKKQRHEVRRKLRRADGAGATLHITQPEDDLVAAVDTFLDLLAQSSPEKAAWLDSGRRAHFHEVATAALAEGTLQLQFLMVGDQPAAVLFNFDYQDRIWVYNSGLDMANFARLSPGVVLTARAIEQAIATGRGHFDFLRGNETYKYRFGAADTEIYRIQISR